jgi:hypothetical protein
VDDQWTIPLNLFAAQLLKLGRLPIQFTVGGRYYAEAPCGGPDWGLRFVVTLLFPTCRTRRYGDRLPRRPDGDTDL